MRCPGQAFRLCTSTTPVAAASPSCAPSSSRPAILPTIMRSKSGRPTWRGCGCSLRSRKNDPRRRTTRDYRVRALGGVALGDEPCARRRIRDIRRGGYHRCVAGVVERAGGFVAKYMGDGVLAYFGYPRADEHDAERAVRAGLALVKAVAALDTAAAAPMQGRVGIGTGLVVVG